MYEIIVDRTFNADHQLRGPEGALEPVHSHNWVVRAVVSAEGIDEMGISLDFNVLKKYLSDILRPMNGAVLEELDNFKNKNASAENMAKYIYDQLEVRIGDGCKLEYVEITEEPNCRARYYK